METKQLVNIEDFDAVKASEHAHKFELKSADGVTGTGVFVLVLGKNADVVQDWTSKVVNKLIRDAEYAKRRGKQVEPQSLEDIRESNIKNALVRVVGWENVQQDYTSALMEKALRRNPHWVEQIIEESDDLGNFPTSASAI
jgi:hypothetical protein